MQENRDILSGLNTAQKKAVSFGEGPLIIVAGAGTGKTKTYLGRGRSPEDTAIDLFKAGG